MASTAFILDQLSDTSIFIDSFAPKQQYVRTELYDASPMSSSTPSSCSSSPLSVASTDLGSNTFFSTRSRVVKLCNLPELADQYLAAIFQSPKNPRPVSTWVQHDRSDTIWAVFGSHQEACAALSLSGPAMTVLPALETDLEPFQNLSKFDISPLRRQPVLHPSASNPDLFRSDFTLSSNSPNLRANFRLGDWICSFPNCAAHNFGRNLVCIGCGAPRSSPPMHPQARPVPSPRFASSFSLPSTPQSTSFPLAAKTAHPLLTPSGRAFAVGGRVQNISSDPLTPCIMWWPDNEPFPEQGQIRPSSVIGVPQPPILNTGNKGPISHQPGDWICTKCNYLNWRRRKVCQTCLPYAEGNGDSISAAVQAERIALLTAVLAQTQISTPPPQPTPRSQSMTPPQVQRSFVDVSPPYHHLRASVHRSQSHFELSSQYSNSNPIYQTSTINTAASSPIYSTTPSTATRHQRFSDDEVHAPAPLLPSFLQEIVTSPAASPVSTSSADLSFEDYSPTRVHFRPGNVTHSSSSSSSSIWTLDGEETKSFSPFPLRVRPDFSGGIASRKTSLEQLGH